MVIRFSTLSFIACVFCLSGRGEVEPHPDRPDRLVDTRGEFSVEYSKGQEAYAEAAFTQMAKWKLVADDRLAGLVDAQEFNELLGSDLLKSKRDEYLAAIASAIGLEASSEAAGKSYDTVLKLTNLVKEFGGADEGKSVAPISAVVWTFEELKARHMAGEIIDPFSIDMETRTFNFSHRFDKDSSEPGILPVLIMEENVNLSPEEIVQGWMDGIYGSIFKLLAEIPETVDSDEGANGIHIVLHEAAEAALVFEYARSRNRRSAMDGMAEFVSWKVLRDLEGIEKANQVYPVADWLRERAHLQNQVKLSEWIASEAEKKEGFKFEVKGLNRAHYDFAAAAFFLIAQRYGDASLTQIWKEVGKTYINRADLGTISEACREVTGRSLFDFYSEVETRPVESIIAELDILRQMPEQAPMTEMEELEIEGIPVAIDAQIDLSPEMLQSELILFRERLQQALNKTRWIDEFKTQEKLTGLHRLVWGFSRERAVPRADLANYIRRIRKGDFRVAQPAIHFNGIEIRDTSDTFRALRAGRSFNGVNFSEPYGSLEWGDIPVFVTGQGIRFRKWVIPIDRSNFDSNSVSNALVHAADQFEQYLFTSSQQLVYSYLGTMALAIAKNSFDYLGENDRWFQEGFAQYVCYGVFHQLLGKEENLKFWNDLFSMEQRPETSKIYSSNGMNRKLEFELYERLRLAFFSRYTPQLGPTI